MDNIYKIIIMILNPIIQIWLHTYVVTHTKMKDLEWYVFPYLCSAVIILYATIVLSIRWWYIYMSDYWFTSDQHFYHTNIIDHCKRPWKTVHLMNEALIDIWNQYVKPQDTVVVLGDLLWFGYKYEQALEWLQANLKGNKILIKGNHDRWYTKNKRYMYNKKVSGVIVWSCHYPLASWPSGICLHGHRHGQGDKIPNRFDVGIDTNPEYRPYHIDEIKSWIDTDVLNRFDREGRE